MWRGCQRLLHARPFQAPHHRRTPSTEGPTLSSPGTRRASASQPERKRFYQNVSISRGEGGFEINLDHRKLKTPQAKLFTVPSEALAVAVATEWEAQKDTVKFYSMHLVSWADSAGASGGWGRNRAPFN
uniref:ATP synthase mitochondrial F1 complex assembly factor 2 n=1 Tax=Sphenodon punctatus TaxID=8508 RepID=A0A8D0GE30_SPHPU